MTIYEEYAIELLLDGHLKGKPIGDGYIVAYTTECKITNPKKLDIWLLNNGYLRRPTIEEAFGRYKVPQLKAILTEKGVKTSGNKPELIERLLNILTENEIEEIHNDDDRYFLSEKGLKYYYENIDLCDLHKNWKYHINIETYFLRRDKNKGFYEIARSIVGERISKKRRTSIDYLFYSEICGSQGYIEEALMSILLKLYCDTNLVDDEDFYFSEFHIDFNGIDNMCDRLQKQELFNIYTTKRIVELGSVYTPKVVDKIYQEVNIKYELLGREEFKQAIDDMLEFSYFDPEPYVDIIKENYRYIAAKIIGNKKSIGLIGVFEKFKKRK